VSEVTSAQKFVRALRAALEPDDGPSEPEAAAERAAARVRSVLHLNDDPQQSPYRTAALLGADPMVIDHVTKAAP